jgi:hypothetical protein
MGDDGVRDGGQGESEGAGKQRRSKKGFELGPLHVEVPEWCKEPKPWFAEEPTPEIVEEIRDWVAETGASHTWRGHTHTPLPDGAIQLKYVGRIELPEKFRLAKRFLVCPICRPNSANFGARPGFIAWFPDERVIRLIGPDCFAKIDKEGHADALKEFQERERRKSDIAFLVSQRDQHRLALKVLNEARLVARAVDLFGPDLHRALDRLNVDLWPNVRTGELQVTETLADPRTGALMRAPRRFGSLDGHELLDPAMKKLEPKFAPHIAFLDETLALSDEEWTSKVGQLDTLPRRDAVKKLDRAFRAARDLRAQVLDLRAFVSTENLATLRRWGSDETEGKLMAVYARRENSTLKIGSWEDRTNSVQIPADLERDIPSIAGLTATKP